jgi:hypothetical protein
MDGKVKKNWWEQFLPQGGTGSTPRQVATSGSATGLGGYNPNQGITSSLSGAKVGPSAPSVTQLAGYSPVDYRGAIDPVTGVIDYTKLVVPGKKTETDAISGLQNKLLNNSMQNQLSGGSGTTGGTTGGDTGGETDTGTYESERDWTTLFNAYRQAGLSAADATRTAQKQAAENTYKAQLAQAQEQGRLNRLASQTARQQISEQDFMQQRALMQGAQSRGLGGSGLEQLGRTQARMSTGQQLNQLAQQEIAANTELRNYLGQKSAERETGLSNAEATYQVQAYNVLGKDLDQLKYLDSIEYRNEVFAWQKENAADEAARYKVDKQEQLLLYLGSSEIDDYTKVALTKLAKEAGTITDERESELLSSYLGTDAANYIYQDEFDWNTPLKLSVLGLGGGTVAAGPIGGILGAAGGFAVGTGLEAIRNVFGDPLKGNYTFTNTKTGATFRGTGAEAIDKKDPNSLVYAYRNRAGYNDIEPFIKNGTIFFRVNGKEFQTYSQAENEWRVTG